MAKLFAKAEMAKAEKAKAEGRNYTPKTLAELFREANTSSKIATNLNKFSVKNNNHHASNTKKYLQQSLKQNMNKFQKKHNALHSTLKRTIENIKDYAELAKNLTKNSNRNTKTVLTMQLQNAMNTLKTIENKLKVEPEQLKQFSERQSRLYKQGGKRRTHRHK